MFRKFLVFSIVGVGLALSGCASRSYVAVRVPPPPPVPPAVGFAPRPGYVWADDAWRLPPHPRAYWVPGHWMWNGHRYYWSRGHWR